MTTYKLNKIFPLLCIFCIGLLGACSNEDDMGKDIPSAAFSFTPQSAQVEEEIEFLNSTFGGSGNYTYLWDFGDGESSKEENPRHIYTEKGVYIICLTATDSHGNKNSYKKTIEIIEKVVEKGDLALNWASSVHLGKLASNSAALSNDEMTVYIASNDHILRSIDAATGVENWNFDMKLDSWGAVASGNCNVSPSVDTDGTIYIATGDGGNGKLFAVNPDGSKKWITFNDPVNGFWNKGNAANPKMRPVTPAFDDKYVYCGNGGSTGSLITVDKTTGNRVKYLTNEDGTSGPAGGVYSGPVISKQGMMFIMCTNYGMFGVSHQEMAKNDNTFTPWAWNIFNGELGAGCHASMALDKDGNVYGLIYGKDLTTKVYCAQADGSVKWTRPIDNTGKQDYGGVVIAADGTVYASLKSQGDLPGGIISLNSEGVINWFHELSESVSGTPAIDKDGHILFGTEKGNFYILSKEGEALAILDVAGAIASSENAYASEWTAGSGKFWSSPVIDSKGNIYIALTNNNDDKQSILVSLSSKYVNGLAEGGWPMRSKDAQHSSYMK